MVVVEYVPHGDLLGYLRKSRGVHDVYYDDPDIQPSTNLTSQQLVTFAWEIADGMDYLSSNKVINFVILRGNDYHIEAEVTLMPPPMHHLKNRDILLTVTTAILHKTTLSSPPLFVSGRPIYQNKVYVAILA